MKSFCHLILLFIMETYSQPQYLPCTEENTIDLTNMNIARRILEQSTPEGYILLEIHPIAQTGRNPHRWLAIYHRSDAVYSSGCQYLQEVRQQFRRNCPYGAEISQAVVRMTPNAKAIQIEFLVNCDCVKVPRRKRRKRFSNKCGSFRYTTEHSRCN